MKKYIYSILIGLGVFSGVFSYASASTNYLVQSVQDTQTSSVWLATQSFTNFQGSVVYITLYVNAASSTDDNLLGNSFIATNATTTLYYPDQLTKVGNQYTFTFYHPVVISYTDEWSFTIGQANSTSALYVYGSAGDSYAFGSATWGNYNSTTNCSFGASHWTCTNAGTPEDLAFEINGYGVGDPTAIPAPGIITDYVSSTSNGFVSGLLQGLFFPSRSVTGFMATAYGNFKQVFPFSIFFSIEQSVADQLATTSPESLIYTASFPGTTAGTLTTYTTSSVSILNQTMIQDRFGATVTNWWYNLLLMLAIVLLSWGIFKMIYHPH